MNGTPGKSGSAKMPPGTLGLVSGSDLSDIISGTRVPPVDDGFDETPARSIYTPLRAVPDLPEAEDGSDEEDQDEHDWGSHDKFNSRAIPARWVVAMCEPLVSPSTRATNEAAMIRFVAHSPEWAAVFFAGLLHEIAVTLPPDDPWVNLAAMVDLDVIRTGEPAPDRSGRMFRRGITWDAPNIGAFCEDGKPFGTVQDAFDLTPPDLGEPDVDLGLAALVPNLSPLAAAMPSACDGGHAGRASMTKAARARRRPRSCSLRAPRR